MLKKINNLTYRLDFSDVIRIHLIIFITQLKSISDRSENLYYRVIFSFSLIKKDNAETNSNFAIKYRSYEIERLLKRRNIKRNIKYLVKWKGFENWDNVWYLIYALQKIKNLIKKCDDRLIVDLIRERKQKTKNIRVIEVAFKKNTFTILIAARKLLIIIIN